eukprot:CAMPEP_0201636276 /NCGR_PEP_ID=MMETSP0493-20130528/8497_1 /ASSEMBLY_ACC=CAM_ASM_000838 /TAXON_ID=420259 /ORGANISM="Thalassiosira gravida, Strain GMp14c1" /LENGTH=848 /DNA_ID=CAMNT_0048108357 /DNA_START=106 /DNA_END=2652 /DNA_ORIENTATION=+
MPTTTTLSSLITLLLPIIIIIGNVGVKGYDGRFNVASTTITEDSSDDTSGDDDGINNNNEDATESTTSSSQGSWTWSNILESRQTIIANGNIWPAPPDESSLDCLVLVTRNQIMWHCPSGNETSHERTILHRGNPGKFRGAFMGLGSDDDERKLGGGHSRMWLLHSPPKEFDQLLELDTVTGEILQRLVIDGCIDGHDAVRVGNSRVFIVDTRHGNIIEIAIPPSSHPYTQSSIEAGAEVLEEEGYVNIVKRHGGFTQADHVNNVAVHPDLLLSNLHGKGALRRNIAEAVASSPTRLTALDRTAPEEEEGRELDSDRDGFESIRNVGTWCHGIAFWEDDTDTSSPSQIKLISLDSKSGAAVSVVLVGPKVGTREVLWEPDEERHPVLRPPEGVARAYNNGAKVFSKGLAVQGGVAYFGVSYARAPHLRATVPESLLVAVDLKTKEELWARVVRSNGLINQILTKSYLGDVQLPDEISSVELTHHGVGGKLVAYCEDIVAKDEENGARSEVICKTAYEDPTQCHGPNARALCCACMGGARRQEPLLAGKLDREAMKIKDFVNATATFVPHHQCRDKNGLAKRLPLEMKTKSKIVTITDIDRDLNFIVKHLCNINVEPIQKLVADMGDEGFTIEYQHDGNNAVITNRHGMDKFKPGCDAITLIFSSKRADKVYHFPWLDGWLSMLRELVLEPLGIPLNQILRMQLANMPRGSDIGFHRDTNAWVQMGHRTHIPIITHPDVFFLAETMRDMKEDNAILRIKSNAGEVYEFNNAKGHAVRNVGPSRVHLIIDWVDDALYDEEKGDVEKLVKLRPSEVCTHPKGINELQCGGFALETNDGLKETNDSPEHEEL